MESIFYQQINILMFANVPLDPNLDMYCLQSFYRGVSPAFHRAGTKHGRVDSCHTVLVLSTASCDRLEGEDKLESAALRAVPAFNEEVGTANTEAGASNAPRLPGIPDLLTIFSGDVVKETDA